MIIATVVGLALGMIIALVVTVTLFLMFFGAMEIMIPNMLTGMVAAMIISICRHLHCADPHEWKGQFERI